MYLLHKGPKYLAPKNDRHKNDLNSLSQINDFKSVGLCYEYTKRIHISELSSQFVVLGAMFLKILVV
jgi:hypothetical protein